MTDQGNQLRARNVCPVVLSCSWFHDCRSEALLQRVKGFRTAAVSLAGKKRRPVGTGNERRINSLWPNGLPGKEVGRRYEQLVRWGEGTFNLTGFHELARHKSVRLQDGVHLSPGGSRLTHDQMRARAMQIYSKHNNQTTVSAARLERKWRRPLVGRVAMWDLLHLLHFTIDHTDTVLMYTSQLIHCLQVYASVRDSTFSAAEADPTLKRDLMLAALVHDVGKLLTLFGEADENVDCMNRLLNPDDVGGGIDGLRFQFNHDTFGWVKLRRYLPARVSDVVKLHSLREIATLAHPDQSGKGFHLEVPPLAKRRPGVAVVIDPMERNFYVTLEQALRFNLRVSGDAHRARFIQMFSRFDAVSKVRTEVIPRVDVEEIDQLLHDFFPGGHLEW